MQFERQKLRSTNAVKDKNFNLPKKKLRSSNAACKTKASIFYAVRKKSRAAVIAGSKGCFLPVLSEWLYVCLAECLFAGPTVQSFRTVIQYIIVRKKSKSKNFKI